MAQEQSQNHKCNCTKGIKTLEKKVENLEKQVNDILRQIKATKRALNSKGV
jgi:DNA-binding FrmR family transcriptional regulator